MSLKEDFATNGYVMLKGAYTTDEIMSIRMLMMEQFLTHGGFAGRIESIRSSVIPDAGNKNGRILDIVLSEPVKAAMRELIEEPIYYLHHSDIHLNWTGGWHRDSIDKPTYYDFLKTDIWAPENRDNYQVYKVALYLQDHSDNDDGFHVVPGSHKYRSPSRPSEVALRSSIGDVVIFDTRLIHRGVLEAEMLAGGSFEKGLNRMSLFSSFGPDNAMSREFALGTIWRQNMQQSADVYRLTDGLANVLAKHGFPPLPGIEPSPQPKSLDALYKTMM
jgi:hypothetical protein